MVSVVLSHGVMKNRVKTRELLQTVYNSGGKLSECVIVITPIRDARQLEGVRKKLTRRKVRQKERGERVREALNSLSRYLEEQVHPTGLESKVM